MLPRGWDRRTTVFLAFALLVLCGTTGARGQVFDLERDRVPMVELHGFWRFHTGDDPDGKLGWAKPDFDDSSWKLLRSDQPLAVQGYPGYGGVLWYRFQVVLPANHPPLALYIAGIGTSYQVFASGRLIGQFGGVPPHERTYIAGYARSLPHRPPLGHIIPIPADIADGTGAMVVAIRVWIWPDWAAFVYNAQAFQALSVGDPSLMSEKRQDRWNHEFWSLSAENALLLGYLLAALAGLGLFLMRPGEGEYLWFSAVELLYAADCAWNLYPAFHPVWFQGYEALNGLLQFLRGICLSIFYLTLLKQPRGWPFWGSMGSAAFGGLMFLPMVMQWMSYPAWLPVINLAWIPFIVCQLVMLSLAAKRGNLDARLLLGPFGMQYGAIVGREILLAFYAFGHGGPAIAIWAGKWEQLFKWPFPISVQNIADFLCQISILAILMLRFARTRRDEERFGAELEAARTVQQVLIPNEVPDIPCFAIECIYKPAGQVGGDFFQILPTPSGGALIVIGDVSGKGMPAAMAVSLLVGTVRTLAHFMQSPGEILAAMNQRMLARSKDGFTTCLVLRIDPDGTVTAANAGHLAPYLGAREIAVGNGLPLGLAAESIYSESTFHLDAGQELTLLTDGIAEARCKGGELFGFERTASISILSAEHIAATAAAFGQQDDITVLKIRRCAAPECAEAPLGAAAATGAA